MRLFFFSPTTTSASSTPSSAIASSSGTTSRATSSVVLFAPALWFGGIIDEKGVEGQRVGEHEIADVVAANRERIERLRLAVSGVHLHSLEMRVHLHVDT